ncbi:hypothetical protein IU403_06250 [Aerococcaceae bacterium zg-BR22]|uniref:hypothetical protein n=1 Tax=Aerococcaceae bacterium zg-1292 TaxID=2774330 RepID=UPI0040633AB4|nr:hypothetical protein [Aerococcaceae bacterium zg-BR22]
MPYGRNTTKFSEGIYFTFGVSSKDELFKYIDNNGLTKRFKRIHFHNSSRTIEEFRSQLNLSKEFIEKYKSIDTINLGGDLLSLYNYGRVKFLKELLEIKKASIFSNINFIFEPGEALIKYGGMLLTTVLNIKEEKNYCNVFLDSSKWVSAPWYTGKPILLESESNNNKFKYCLYGNTMFPYDNYFSTPVFLPKLEEGDRLLLPEFGAYTLSNFRSFHLINKPNEYILSNNELKRI